MRIWKIEFYKHPTLDLNKAHNNVIMIAYFG